MLAFVVWRSAPDLRRSAFLRFSRMATVLVAVLLVAGTVVAIERLPAVADLWETSYGRILLLKLAIVALALGWGAVHHMVVRPRLERGDAAGRGIGRSLMGESAAAMGVLLVAAVLVNGSPPPVETGVQAAGASAARP
jgi:copper transport protein